MKKIYIIAILFLFAMNLYSQSGMILCDTLSESDVIDICEDNQELSIELIGLFKGDILLNYSPNLRFSDWQLNLTAGIYSKSLAVGAGFNIDLERENGKLFNIKCTKGFEGSLNILLTKNDAWFTPGFGYKIVIHKDYIGKYFIIEPQLQANLGTSFFLALSLNAGIGI